MTSSARMKAVQDPVIPVVGDLIRATPGTISLGQGVVGYGPPAEALEEVARLKDDPRTHRYASVDGIEPLLEALTRKLADENGTTVGRGRRVMVTAGGNMGFLNAVLAVADPGDEILLNAPYYFNHEMAVAIAGCRPVVVETDDAFQLRPGAIADAITKRTRAVVTVSPNNPTGAVYPEAALREVNALCRERGVHHVHDEAYEYFTYDGARHFSPASIPGSEGHTIALYSFSKAYGMAGWRMGFMVIPDSLHAAVRKIQDTNLICPSLISQAAAIGALKAGAPFCRGKLASIAAVRGLVKDALFGIADLCTVPRADGAFYFILKIGSPIDPMDLVRRLVTEHKVALIPGTPFGLKGACTLRLSYGPLDREGAADGIGRLTTGLRAILGDKTPCA